MYDLMWSCGSLNYSVHKRIKRGNNTQLYSLKKLSKSLVKMDCIISLVSLLVMIAVYILRQRGQNEENK